MVLIFKSKVSPASRLLCKILKQDFSKFFEVNFSNSLTKSLDKSNLGNNLLKPDKKFSEFLNIILKCLETYASKPKLSREKIKIYFKPWLTKSIQKGIKKKKYINIYIYIHIIIIIKVARLSVKSSMKTQSIKLNYRSHKRDFY